MLLFVTILFSIYYMPNRSKLEYYIAKLIRKDFPKLKIKRNDRTLCEGLEIDILIPELKLAIECNGIIHYEPIYGIKRLSQVQCNDLLKKEIIKNKNHHFLIVKQVTTFSQSKSKYLYSSKIKPLIKKLQEKK